MAKKATHTKAASQNWFGQALRRSGWRPERQVIAVGTLGVFIALILGALYLSQVALEASRGREMRTFIEQRDELERVNEELRVEIAELKSLPRLQAQARALGFVQATIADMDYIPVDGYTANRQETVVLPRTDSAVVVQPEYDETFGGWLEVLFRDFRAQFADFNTQGT
ncbi:MAG: hypothetical protein H7Y11_11755 [Armatimonadetes bacterium]|nr:hypothetical protein [Anaerolineae bacterium]